MNVFEYPPDRNEQGMATQRSSPIPQHARCSDISLQRQEPLLGTAPRVDTWFLLSYHGPMKFKAFEESNLSPAVREHLSTALESISNSRLLLIKPRLPASNGGLLFFVINGREVDPFYRSFELNRYEDLLELDLHRMMVDEGAHAEKIDREPIYLVCTNGNRDPCCAQFGLRILEDLDQSVQNQVWQSSHVGGHRFAANVLVFPQGIYYGRIKQVDVPLLHEAVDVGQVLLENYRGRSCHAPRVQAAESFLRQNTENNNFDAFRMLDKTMLDEAIWSVRFLAVREQSVHRVNINSKVSSDQNIVSCRGDKVARVVRYELLSYEVEGFRD
jgi:hypothetical protein